jgi:glutaredoxin
MDVTLYSTKTCQYCWETRQYLKDLQIPFHEIRIDDDVEAAREVQRLVGDQVVPVVVVRQDQAEPVTVVGFDRQRLQVALGGMV